jgi:hypothetical protein
MRTLHGDRYRDVPQDGPIFCSVGGRLLAVARPDGRLSSIDSSRRPDLDLGS